MKQLGYLIAMLVLLGTLTSNATPLLPYLDPVRTAITNELTIQSNTLPLDKKLITKLNAALKLIDRPGATNLLKDAKLLAALVPPLTKSSVSNVFAPLLDQAVDNYLAVLLSAAEGASNSLTVAFPSGVHRSADKALLALSTIMSNAQYTADLLAAAKLVSKGVAKLNQVNVLVTKSLHVAAPPAGVTATVKGAESWSYRSTGAVATPVINGYSLVNSGQALLRLPFGQRTVTLGISGINSGANTLAVGSGSGGVCQILVTEIFMNGTGASYTSQSGTIQVTYNPSTKALVGTFTAVMAKDKDSSKQITITGSFSAITL
jgi:hypothetical protein